MDFFIARQPIFTVHKRLFAYELLYRGYLDNTLLTVSGNRATTSLLSSAFLTEGIGVISGSKPCFINFTEELLVKNIAFSFPPSQIVVEILEDVKPTAEVIKVVRNLAAHGYTIALDDFIYHRSLDPLLEHAGIIKIDVRLTPLDTIMRTLHKLSRFKIKLLAEKVETLEEFEKANRLGFHYFQGYFFSKPEKILVKEVVSAKLNLINLLAEVTRKQTTLNKLQKIISADLAISYKLLRFLNSAYFYRLEKVRSVRHAIAYIGEKELRRFIILVIVSELAMEKPGELVRMSLVRAKFCEMLAEQSSLKEFTSEVFLVGMFSFMDTMLETSMAAIMEKLPVTDSVKDALVHHRGTLAPFLDAVVAYERRQEQKFLDILADLAIESSAVPEYYLQALKYANGML